ncbi:WG repeat-containing protein [uncultured Alistipes sp.]|uniref:WG repeat-containing protein n=1 Tax=uncultured Alistipes sp. TaxID=538949 RepID=UPI0025FD7821|nr:WG repeat-containing protein [uncultured Alistipes sp.]
MTATVQQFTRALQAPDLSFATLADARAVTDSNGMPRLVRTSRFVEAEVEWEHQRWLVAMPLTPSALPCIERTVSALGRLNTESLATCRILPGEMRWTDASGNERHTNLFLQHLPAGREFAEVLLTEDRTLLTMSLDTLRDALRELNFTHNNLKENNLRWHNGRFIPIRYYDAQIGAAEGGDTEAFERLRLKIAQAQANEQTVSDVSAPYDPLRPLTGHRWTSHVFEGLVCVEDEAGFGFVDTDNNVIIATQFLWAGDFREGRAEVQTPTGMGLIDREGNYVIEPEYEIVDYDPATSIVRVRLDGRWALFDYLGRRITEFSYNGIPEPHEAGNCI